MDTTSIDIIVIDRSKFQALTGVIEYVSWQEQVFLLYYFSFAIANILSIIPNKKKKTHANRCTLLDLQYSFYKFLWAFIQFADNSRNYVGACSKSFIESSFVRWSSQLFLFTEHDWISVNIRYIDFSEQFDVHVLVECNFYHYHRCHHENLDDIIRYIWHPLRGIHNSLQ